MGISGPHAAFLSNRASLHLTQRMKTLATNFSCQVDAGCRFLRQIEKLEINSGNKEKEAECTTQGSFLPADPGGTGQGS